MVDRSFFYSGPRIYRAGLLLLHGKNLAKRYKYIAEKAGTSVLEPACGPALLPDYLEDNCVYKGFDINEKFVGYAKKRGLDVRLGDALNPESYSESDTVVLCDAIHHMGLSNEIQVLEYSLSSAKQKLIICEPFKDPYIEMTPNWLPGSRRLLNWWYNYIERDGHNQVRFENIRLKKELEEIMMEGFGVVPRSAKRDIKNIGEDLIVTYNLD